MAFSPPRRRGAPLALLVFFLLFYYFLTRGKERPLSKEFEGASFKRTIVAIGDLHSYYPNALKALQLANVVDDNAVWTGEVDYLAQTGDIVDRGADTIQLYQLLDRLRSEAKSHGGRVLTHLGNHEFMNLIGDWRYVYESDLKTFDSIEARQRAFSAHGWIGQTLYGNYTVTSRLPLHPSAGNDPYEDFDPSTKGKHHMWDAAFSFVHGGIHPALPFITPYPSRINGLGKSLVRKLINRPMPLPHPPAPNASLPQSASPEEVELYGVNGPLWFRGWAEIPEDAHFCEVAKETLGKMGVRRMIMGHTPTKERIVSRCEGKVIIIDTAMTPAYGGVVSALKIEYGLFPDEQITPLEASSLNVTTTAKRRWRELELVHALYEDRVEELVRSDKMIDGSFS